MCAFLCGSFGTELIIIYSFYIIYYINLYISLKGSFDFFIDQAHSQIEHFKKKEEERSFSEDSN